MNKLFLEVFNNSLAAGLLIVVVIMARFLLRKAPKWITCLLWGMVAIRLVFPIQLESVFSLIPSAAPVPVDIEYAVKPEMDTGIGAVDRVVNPVLQNYFAPRQVAGFGSPESMNPLQKWIFLLSVLWVAGVMAMLLYALISYLILKRRVRAAIAIEDEKLTYTSKKQSALSGERSKIRIYECDDIDSPFLLGIVRLQIYMPPGMSDRAKECVRVHERTHIKRGDHVWKPLGFLILSVYWFNPLCWIAYFLLCRDIEYACDEKATMGRDRNWKADYCQALLEHSIPRKRIAACPVAFGEVSVKNRIKSVLHNKKPVFGMLVLGVAACIVVAVCFLTNPKKDIGVDSDGNPGNEDVVESFIKDELVEPEKSELEEPEKAVTEESKTEESKPEEGDLLSEYSPFGQLGEKGPHYEYGVYPEKYLVETVLYETMADLNHDTIKDYIKVVCYNDKVGSTYRETVELSAIGCYVMVYKGIADGICERKPMFISRNFHLSHVGNGVVCLSKYNGLDYLLFANIYEMQGDAYYDYAMVYLDEEKGILTADSDAVEFAVDSHGHSDWDKLTHREDVIPEFKKKMEPYLEESEILMCLTMDEELHSKIICFSTQEERIPANYFFGWVWEWTH